MNNHHHPRYEVAEGEFEVTRGQNELTILLPEIGMPDEIDVKFLHLSPPPCDPHPRHHHHEDTILWNLFEHGKHFKIIICWSVESEARTIAWKAVFR